MAVNQAKKEELDKEERLQDPFDGYYNNLQKFALDKLNFYNCYDCKSPFYGGRNECG